MLDERKLFFSFSGKKQTRRREKKRYINKNLEKSGAEKKGKG